MLTASLSGIAQLSVTERIQLVEDIWDTIAAHPDSISLPDAQVAELDRRLNAYREDSRGGASWQEVQQRVRGQK